MRGSVSVVLLLLGVLLGSVAAHSWMQCADYTEENGRFWSADKCRAYPRNYGNAFQYQNYLWGGDAGYNHQPTEGAPCKTPPGASDYSAAFPKARYTVGQRVCLAWPPKNHVAAACNNPNIQDAGTRIYRSAKNPSSDPSLTEFHNNLVHDFGANKGTNGQFFQNCPDFCANPDKALCTSCFEIPKLDLGSYAFMWEWSFNGLNDRYTTCFDVDIVEDSGNFIKTVYPHVTPDAYRTLDKSTDVPKTNDKVSYDKSGSGGSGMSPAGAAVLAIFIIAIVAGIVGSILFVKLGYGTIDTKFPFYHKKQADPYNYNAAK